MAIAYVGDKGNAATTTALSISYSSTGGNTLIVAGTWYDSLGVTTGITSITDSAGNTWHYSTSDASNPPAQHNVVSGQIIGTFIGWCIGASAVTTVTVTLPNSVFVHFDVSEWSGINNEDTGGTTGSITGGTGTIPGASLTCAGTGELLIGSTNSVNASTVSQPSNGNNFPNNSAPTQYIQYNTGNSGTAQFIWPATTTGYDYSTSEALFQPPGGGTTHMGNAALSLAPTFGRSVTHTAKIGAALSLAPAFATTVAHTAKIGAALVVTPTFKAAKSTKTVGNFYPFNQNSTDEYYPFR